MQLRQFDVWIADLNPRIGTEPGKIRPVVVVQTNLLNTEHPSTLVCPISSKVDPESEILRVHLKKGMAGLKKDCDILVDQLRAIDNKRLREKSGSLPPTVSEILKENLTIILDLD